MFLLTTQNKFSKTSDKEENNSENNTNLFRCVFLEVSPLVTPVVFQTKLPNKSKTAAARCTTRLQTVNQPNNFSPWSACQFSFPFSYIFYNSTWENMFFSQHVSPKMISLFILITYPVDFITKRWEDTNWSVITAAHEHSKSQISLQDKLKYHLQFKHMSIYPWYFWYLWSSNDIASKIKIPIKYRYWQFCNILFCQSSGNW